VFFKLILWGAALYLMVRSVRSLLTSWGGVRNRKSSNARRSQKETFGDVEDAEFEDIEEAS